MKSTFRLHEEPVNKDAVVFFRGLADKAEEGEVLGWTGAYMTKNRQFVTHSAGEPARNPVFAIGMLVVLILKLARMVLK